jgi:hypothetical protein
VTLVDSQLGQLNSLIQYLSNTLPLKISTAWQGQSKPHGNLASTSESVSTALDSDCVGQRSPRSQKQRSIESEISDDVRVSTSTKELENLISQTVAETCREWLSNRKEQDGDSDQESEDEIEQRDLPSLSTIGDIQYSGSITTMPEHWAGYHAPQRGWSSTNCAGADMGFPTLTSDQSTLSLTPWAHPPGPNLPSYSLSSLSMFNSNSNPAAATAYDFSYLPMSPGIPFVDISTQPDMAPSTDLDASGTGIGSGGALGNLFAPESLSAAGWASWEDTNVSAETTSSTLTSEANQDP